MSNATSHPSPSRVLILAPHGRDAAVAETLLREGGFEAVVCAHLPALESAIDDEAGFAVVTEDSVRSADLRGIVAKLGSQPPWSDLPFIVLTQRGGGSERRPEAARLFELLGNVTFLERPFHPTTFISAARSAARARQRQYDARARIEELHEGEERLRTALLAGRLGSWELDLANSTLTTSPTCKELFGRGADEHFSYEDLLASVHPDDSDRMKEAVRRTIETGEDYLIEYRLVRPDRTIRWAEIRARLVTDRLGRSRLVGVSSDITERKRAEADLRQMNETLEDRVQERTAELERAHDIVLEEIGQRERAEALLQQAQKMEMIGQLTGGVAHDFNNLLMAVLSNLDMLRKLVPDNYKALHLIDGALEGAKRGASLTQRLLAFARRQDLQVKPSNLTDLVRGMIDLIERSVGTQIEIRLQLPENLPAAMVDANQIELALLNLAVNARDAMPDGGILSIEVDEQEPWEGSELPSGPYVRLIVTDTGQGMDEETLARATEPFFSTKEVGKGTGLGLSMVHGVALQLHGVLRLSSQVGLGTRAELWLPATSARAEAKVATSEPPPMEEAPKLTILVVDDDALIAMTTVDMLEDLGHQVIEANSGERALEVLRNSEAVDLMVTDYSMPKMNGAELAKAARAVRPDLPIILATGYADLPPDAGIELPRIGKPYQQEHLAAEISKLGLWK